MPQFAGTVRWFKNAKGYGFLGRNDGGPDVFAHYSSIQKSGYRSLKEGEAVTFDIVKGEKGLQADNVMPVAATGVSAATRTAQAASTAHAASAASAMPEQQQHRA